MKRFVMIALAVLVDVSLVTTVFAQAPAEKAPKAATDTGKEKGKALGKEMEKGEKKGAIPATPAQRAIPTPAPPGSTPSVPGPLPTPAPPGATLPTPPAK